MHILTTSGNGLILQKGKTRILGKRTVKTQTAKIQQINLLDLPMDTLFEVSYKPVV